MENKASSKAQPSGPPLASHADELKRAEEALRFTEERLRSILANSVDVLYRRNLQTNRYDCVSPSVEAVTGYTPEEFTSSGLQATTDRIHPDDLDRSLAAIQKVLTGTTGHGYAEYRYRRKDGVYRWFSDHYRVMRDEKGRLTYWVGTVRDITDLKNVEESMKRSNQELEAIVAERTAQLRMMTARVIGAEEAERERIGNMLHEDLQQVLTALRYALETPQQDSSANEQSALANRLLDQAIQLTRSLSADLLPPALIEEDLGEALSWLVNDVHQQFGLAVHLTAARVPRPTSKSLQVFILRAVRELLLNIVKHADTRIAQMSLRPLDGNVIQIEITDHGVGFDATDAPASGLGMFRIRETASLFGGSLTVTSSPGTGTHVTLTLPADAESSTRA